MKVDAIGLYVHVPFCLSKCSYCDFCSYAGCDEQIVNDYVDALIREIRSYKQEPMIRVDTIFFGGGTPSLLDGEQLFKLTEAIRECFDISSLREFTVEVNPKTVTREKLLSYKSAGVDRLSIGLQSIHENELKILGRVHNYSDFLFAYNLARDCGFDNINVDLIYGIPSQTKDSFISSLKKVASLGCQHLSLYSLILEENTPLYRMKDQYLFPSDDEVVDIYESANKMLSEFGFEHYEISNYSLASMECKHNLKYWTDCEYIGIGIAAHSYFSSSRYSNEGEKDSANFLNDYINKKCFCRSYVTEDINDHAFEYVMLHLRLSKGLDLKKFKCKFGYDFYKGREELLTKYSSLGLLEASYDNIRLTEGGMYLSNAILAELL